MWSVHTSTCTSISEARAKIGFGCVAVLACQANAALVADVIALSCCPQCRQMLQQLLMAACAIHQPLPLLVSLPLCRLLVLLACCGAAAQPGRPPLPPPAPASVQLPPPCCRPLQLPVPPPPAGPTCLTAGGAAQQGCTLRLAAVALPGKVWPRAQLPSQQLRKSCANRAAACCDVWVWQPVTCPACLLRCRQLSHQLCLQLHLFCASCWWLGPWHAPQEAWRGSQARAQGAGWSS